MSNIIYFPEREDPEDDEYVFNCECLSQDAIDDGYSSVFYVSTTKYTCAHCGTDHSFEQVHGSID